MVDVVRDNFSALLPRVEELINECDFVGKSICPVTQNKSQ